jgi:nickel transport protein
MQVGGTIANRCLRRRIAGFLGFSALLLLAAKPASAHKVTIFAWVEGDTVHTESKLSGGKAVKEGEVIVYDSDKNRLLDGKTSDEGKFSFRVPKKTDLRIVLHAGMGHRAEWRLPAEDLGGVGHRKTGAVATETIVPEKPENPRQPVPGLSRDDIQLAVERALDKKLEPIFKMLAESRERRPSLADILGGIGYILGLVGVGTYFHYRRKRSDSSAP